MNDLIEEALKELEPVIDGVFIHGRETPDKSYDLPKGQVTIADAINAIRSKLEEAYKRGRQDARKLTCQPEKSLHEVGCPHREQSKEEPNESGENHKGF